MGFFSSTTQDHAEKAATEAKTSASQAYNDINSRMDHEVDALSDAARQASQKADQLLGNASQEAQKLWEERRPQLEKMARDAGEQLEDFTDRTRKQLSHTLEDGRIKLQEAGHEVLNETGSHLRQWEQEGKKATEGFWNDLKKAPQLGSHHRHLDLDTEGRVDPWAGAGLGRQGAESVRAGYRDLKNEAAKVEAKAEKSWMSMFQSAKTKVHDAGNHAQNELHRAETQVHRAGDALSEKMKHAKQEGQHQLGYTESKIDQSQNLLFGRRRLYNVTEEGPHFIPYLMSFGSLIFAITTPMAALPKTCTFALSGMFAFAGTALRSDVTNDEMRSALDMSTIGSTALVALVMPALIRNRSLPNIFALVLAGTGLTSSVRRSIEHRQLASDPQIL